MVCRWITSKHMQETYIRVAETRGCDGKLSLRWRGTLIAILNFLYKSVGKRHAQKINLETFETWESTKSVGAKTQESLLSFTNMAFLTSYAYICIPSSSCSKGGSSIHFDSTLPLHFQQLGYLGPVSQKSRNFSGLFRVSQFPLYLRNAEVLSHQTLQSSRFFLH